MYVAVILIQKAAIFSSISSEPFKQSSEIRSKASGIKITKTSQTLQAKDIKQSKSSQLKPERKQNIQTLFWLLKTTHKWVSELRVDWGNQHGSERRSSDGRGNKENKEGKKSGEPRVGNG